MLWKPCGARRPRRPRRPSTPAAKKVVGGSCRLSPAMTACRPRSSDVTASSGSTWLASSKITTSNSGRSPGMSWLTESGLAIQHGRRASDHVRRLGEKSARSGRCRACFSASRLTRVLCSGFAFRASTTCSACARLYALRGDGRLACPAAELRHDASCGGPGRRQATGPAAEPAGEPNAARYVRTVSASARVGLAQRRILAERSARTRAAQMLVEFMDAGGNCEGVGGEILRQLADPSAYRRSRCPRAVQVTVARQGSAKVLSNLAACARSRHRDWPPRGGARQRSAWPRSRSGEYLGRRGGASVRTAPRCVLGAPVARAWRTGPEERATKLPSRRVGTPPVHCGVPAGPSRKTDGRYRLKRGSISVSRRFAQRSDAGRCAAAPSAETPPARRANAGLSTWAKSRASQRALDARPNCSVGRVRAPVQGEPDSRAGRGASAASSRAGAIRHRASSVGRPPACRLANARRTRSRLGHAEQSTMELGRRSGRHGCRGVCGPGCSFKRARRSAKSRSSGRRPAREGRGRA